MRAPILSPFCWPSLSVQQPFPPFLKTFSFISQKSYIYIEFPQNRFLLLEYFKILNFLKYFQVLGHKELWTLIH